MLWGVLTDKCVEVLLGVALAKGWTSVWIAVSESSSLGVPRILGRIGIGSASAVFCRESNPITCAVVEHSLDKPADVSSAPAVHLLPIEAGHGVAVPGIDGVLGIVGQIDSGSSVDVVNGCFHLEYSLSD